MYNNLPAKLQSKKKEIPASELIIKAIEFITLLREVLALGPECEEGADKNGNNEGDDDFSEHHQDSPSKYNEHQGLYSNASQNYNEDYVDLSSSQTLHKGHEKFKEQDHRDNEKSMEQDVCIEINPSDILPPHDDNGSTQLSDVRFSKPLDCAQVKSTISLPRNLRITPVGKLNQTMPTRMGAKCPSLKRHHVSNTSSSQYSSSLSHGTKNEVGLPPPTLIRKEGSIKSPTSVLGHKVIKIPPANGEKGLPTVIEFPKGSPFLTKLDTKVGADEGDHNGTSSNSPRRNSSNTGQSLLRKHLQEPAKGIQDSSQDRQKIRIRKDLGASPETNEYNILDNNDATKFSNVSLSSSSRNSFGGHQGPLDTISDLDAIPKICISSVQSLKNKENPFTDTLQIESIERRRGRPVVPKKTTKSRSQSDEFNGELAMFKEFEKYDFFNFLSTRLRIVDKDAETILTYNWIHELLFEQMFSLCSELQFARFCHVVSMRQVPCVLLQNPAWSKDKIKGTLSLSGRNYCLPLLLLKLFRPNFEQLLLSKIVLYSKKQCDISNPKVSVDRESTICINPWHYEKCDEEKFLSKSVGHECQVRLFADADNGTRLLCFLCKSPGSIEDVFTPIPPTPLSPPTPPLSSLELTPISVTNNVIPDQDSELKIYVERPKYKIGDKHKIVTIRKKKSLPTVVLKDPNSEEEERKRQCVRRPQLKYDGSVCINCGTTKTTLWRRTAESQLICNACGCYLKLHGRHRPIKYNSDTIRTRSRKRKTKKRNRPHLGIKSVINNQQNLTPLQLGNIIKIAEELEQKSIKVEEQNTKALNVLFESAKMKEIPASEEKSVEEMEQDFEGMIKDFEDEINNEGHDTKSNLELSGGAMSKEVFNDIQDVIVAETRELKDEDVAAKERQEKEISSAISTSDSKELINPDECVEPPEDTDPDEILLIIDETNEMDEEMKEMEEEDDITDDIDMIEEPTELNPTKDDSDVGYINGDIEDPVGLEAIADTISVNDVVDTISVSSGMTDSGSEGRRKRYINVIDGNTNGIDIIDLKKEVVDIDSDTTCSEKSVKIKPPKRSDMVRPLAVSKLKEKARSYKVPGHYGYQCRKCFDWFDTKLDLNNHACTKRYLMSENGNMSIYACKFCGCFEHTKTAIQPHVDRCKTFGFSHLYHSEGIVSQQQVSSDMDNDSMAGGRKGRKRPNRQTLSSKEESTCSQCNYVSLET